MSEVALPYTGELVSLDDPAACARAYGELKEIEAQLKELREAFAYAIREESARQGTKTLHFANGVIAKISPSTGIHWDVEILAELLEAGLPSDRYDELVRAEVSYKVDGSIIRQLRGSNPEYAEIIDRAEHRYEKTPYVSVSRR